MNILTTYVTNITNVEIGLPYNSVRITADFDCWGHKDYEEIRLLPESDYKMIIEKGYYLG